MFHRIGGIASVLLGLFVLNAGPAFAHDEDEDGVQPVRVHGTIVDVAVKTPALSTLVTALTAADLVTTLQGKGPFTVFAPTNAAFAKVPAPLLNFLLSDVPALKSVLLYHVAGGTRQFEDGEETIVVRTVQGENVFVRLTRKHGKLALTVNNSTVALAPIKVDNGIVYVIDSVLLPQF
jgi:uncharacterized surface protein with fasciclin (FAS1) repeats